MKKITVILFSIFYLLLAAGYSIDMHWCCNKVKIVSYHADHKKKCPCSKKMPPGCCKDVHLTVKLSDNQQPASQLIPAVNNFVQNLFVFSAFSIPIPVSLFVFFDFTKYHAPPFKNKQPVYLFNSVFLI